MLFTQNMNSHYLNIIRRKIFIDVVVMFFDIDFVFDWRIIKLLLTFGKIRLKLLVK